MDTSSKSLPSVGSLLSDTWKLFTSTWNTSVKTSLFLLAAPVLSIVFNLLVKQFALGLIAKIVFAIIGAIIFVWAYTRVMLTMLNLEAQKQPLPPSEESQKAISLLLSLVWVWFLVFLVVAGGTLLFIIPGIYFGIALTFSAMILLDQGKRGTQALAASRALVKGRWWETIGYSIVGSIVFGLPVSILSNIVASAVFFLTYTRADSPIVTEAMSLVSYIVMVAFFPLLISYQIKLYRALQRSR